MKIYKFQPELNAATEKNRLKNQPNVQIESRIVGKDNLSIAGKKLTANKAIFNNIKN